MSAFGSQRRISPGPRCTLPSSIIFIKERTRNPAEIEIYKKLAPAGMAGHPITMRVAHGRKEVVEGPDFEDLMMLEFPSFAEAQAWYNNPAYQAACEHRFQGGDYRAFIIEGVAPAAST